MNAETVEIAAIADLHCSKATQSHLRQMFAQIQKEADILLISGDITTYGLPEEAKLFVDELSSINIPVIAVLGNHDYEHNKQDEIAAILTAAGLKVLDGTTCEVMGIGFAGVKGFAGGFGQLELQPWGEEAIKKFVDQSVSEALKLEAALARLKTKIRIVVMHYAPIEETVAGEPREIYPFLGSSRLEEVLNRYQIYACFHGHAHAGCLEGRTSTGIPVYNVAMPLLLRRNPNQLPYRLISVEVEKPGESN